MAVKKSVVGRQRKSGAPLKSAKKRGSEVKKKRVLAAKADDPLSSLKRSIKLFKKALFEKDVDLEMLKEWVFTEKRYREKLQTELSALESSHEELKSSHELLSNNITTIIDNALSEARTRRVAERSSGPRASPFGAISDYGVRGVPLPGSYGSKSR